MYNDSYEYVNWGMTTDSVYINDTYYRKFLLERLDDGNVADSDYTKAYIEIDDVGIDEFLKDIEYGKNCVCFGDSRMQGVGNSTNKCTNIMEKILKCSILNIGIGGTTYSKDGAGDGSFTNIVDAIVGNSWTYMDAFMQSFITTYPQFAYVEAYYNQLKCEEC